MPHRPFGAPPHCDGEAKGIQSKAPHRNGELSAKHTEGHPELQQSIIEEKKHWYSDH